MTYFFILSKLKAKKPGRACILYGWAKGLGFLEIETGKNDKNIHACFSQDC